MIRTVNIIRRYGVLNVIFEKNHMLVGYLPNSDKSTGLVLLANIEISNLPPIDK